MTTVNEIFNITPEQYFQHKVEELLKDGRTKVFIYDTDDEAYNSGYVDYLMNNFDWINKRDFFVAYITIPTA